MTITQRTLHDYAARQIRISRPDLTNRHDTATLIQLHREITAAPSTDGKVVICVVRGFHPVSLIRASCAFAAGLTPEQVSAWRRSFTRTMFLAGNPRNLVDRFTFAHVAEGGLTAWTPPSTMDELDTLRRLLRLFEGLRQVPPWPVTRIAVPGPAYRPPVRRDLYVTSDALSTAGCLVHLNHLLADAVFDGLIAAGDELILRQVPRLIGITEPFAAVRVGVDQANPDRLRAYTGLSQPPAAVASDDGWRARSAS